MTITYIADEVCVFMMQYVYNYASVVVLVVCLYQCSIRIRQARVVSMCKRIYSLCVCVDMQCHCRMIGCFECQYSVSVA